MQGFGTTWVHEVYQVFWVLIRRAAFLIHMGSHASGLEGGCHTRAELLCVRPISCWDPESMSELAWLQPR